MAKHNAASVRASAKDAADVAAKHAGAVDRDARFPHEAFAAIKANRLLGMMVPAELGGAGLSIEDVAAVCSVLAGGCASTGLIFAMHQIQIASLVNAGMAGPFHRELLAEIAKSELLVGSATTEGATGGDIRSSDCAVVTQGGHIGIEKLGTCISYGLEADVILLTARRNPEAPASDQVIVSLRRSDYTLSDRKAWDTLGMRGTASDTFTLRARGRIEQVLPKPFIEIAAQSMLPTTHIFWASAWHGLARDAFQKAQGHVRSQARANPGRLAPGAPRLTIAAGKLQLLR
ncbi:MAG: acyl-CoA/acyl-ACP dehydrogenase, partial [Proteobacteria bacterium]|nr:acyl-CoA/acyl-ACP dehydrogenase [Pseudomonadota bacterium]